MACRPLLFLLAALSLTGCIGKALTPEPDSTTDTVVRRAVTLLGQGDLAALQQLSREDVRAKLTQPLVDELRVRLGDDVKLECVSYRKTTMYALSQRNSPPKNFVGAEYQLQSSLGFSLLQVQLEGTEAALEIVRLHLQPLPGDLEELNAWRFSGKPLRNYVVLGVGLLNLALIGYALYRCARSRVRRKWLWMLFVASAVGQLAVNWTNGELGFRMFHLQLFGLGATKVGSHAPWIFAVGFPLGALLFLWRQRRMKQQPEAGVNLVGDAPPAPAVEPVEQTKVPPA
jgi:hypothetical protein